ncbi:MAG TPA: metallophosphoesterase [Planctomycetota bacterium]|nr:metallophosphoesterase [Planctomycetota bacterium]
MEDPRAPAVRLAVIGDIHAHLRFLGRVLERIARESVDGILLVGDIGAGGRRLTLLGKLDRAYFASVDQVFAAVRALSLPCLWVPGNHDDPGLSGEGNVDFTCAAIAGLRVAGVGGAGPARFGFAYEWSEDSIRARSVPGCDVLLCHSPPFDTELDRVPSGDHVGSAALRELALRHDGVYVCGHIHESPGAVVLGRSLCMNVGGLGEPFGRPQLGFIERSDSIPGGWRVIHEDLASGLVRSWTRAGGQEAR